MWGSLDNSTWTDSEAEGGACESGGYPIGGCHMTCYSDVSRVLWPQVKESVGVPVVANGDIRSEGDVERVKEATGVNGECGCGFDSGKY